jgi:osmoprotectant transport system ATP-binding protein
MRREFKRIHERIRMTVIVVTHDMAEAFELGDRVGVVHDGDLVVCDAPAKVAASSDPRVRPLVETVTAALAAAGR